MAQALDRSPNIHLQSLVHPQVVGSGTYSTNEVIEYLSLLDAHNASQRHYATRLMTFASDAEDSELNKGEEAVEDTAKVHAALPVAYARLQRRFSEAYSEEPPTLQGVRDAKLRDLLSNFESYDTDSTGGLSLPQSRLSATLFTALNGSGSGELTTLDILSGISLANRP